MHQKIYTNTDNTTPIRLLGLMRDWANEQRFSEIWGTTLGQHFWRKFTIERQSNIINFILELEPQNELKLFDYLYQLSHFNGQDATTTTHPEPQLREYMIFYRRNHATCNIRITNTSTIALTHQYICNIQAYEPIEAYQQMTPNSWNLSHDIRCTNSALHLNQHPAMTIGDALVEYDQRGIKTAYVIKTDPTTKQPIADELPPW